MPHYTQDEWMRLVAENFPSASPTDMEAFRNANNVFVDGLPEPTYTGPLSSGGSAGVKQGTTTMDPEDETELPPVGPLPYKSVGDWSQSMQGLSAEEAAYGKQQESERKRQYDAAREAILERRFGPSASEQLFALSAAIGTPMIRPSFGGVMRNVSMSMADMAKANREAERSRAEALMNLEQSYMSGADAAKMAEFKARREAMAPMGAVLARTAEGKPRRTGFNPVTGTLVYMDSNQPVEQANLPVLTVEQVAKMSRDPRNRGMRFQTPDGRPMEIM